MFFRVRQELSEMGWDRVVDERVSGLFEGRAWTFAVYQRAGRQAMCSGRWRSGVALGARARCVVGSGFDLELDHWMLRSQRVVCPSH